MDSYVQAIEHAENIGTDVPDTALSDIVGSSFSVDSLKSAIDLIEAEVKSTAMMIEMPKRHMDTDPVLSEDIPESSIEPEVMIVWMQTSGGDIYDDSDSLCTCVSSVFLYWRRNLYKNNCRCETI